jgi:hypothetical protein
LSTAASSPPVPLTQRASAAIPPVHLAGLIAVTLAMLGPSMLGFVIVQGGLVRPLTPDLGYLAVPAIFIGLWIFSHFDQVRPPGSGLPIK